MEWISVKNKLPYTHCILRVRRENGEETKAYFHADKMGWAHNYYKFPWTHFQDKKTLEWLEDVTHWMSLPQQSKE
jgi:hypothetical protein